MHPPSLLSQRLRMAMALRNINKAALARLVGVDQKTPGNWVRDNEDPEQTEPTAVHIARICHALNVSADYLLGRSPDPIGLVPGRYLVDLDEEQAPTSAKSVVAIEIPARFELTEKDDAELRQARSRERWRELHGRKGQ